MKIILVLVLVFSLSFSREVINDITLLNPVEVENVFHPKTLEEIQEIVKKEKRKIAIGGGRYSMGGQTALKGAVQIDMRGLNKVIKIDKEKKLVTVQAGVRWRDLQEEIDKENLSIKIMQTYSNFTVGGSISVNVHGWYVGQGPIIRSVESIKVITADGQVHEASPKTNSELFYGAIGGYGAMGIIAEATLQLVENTKVERTSETMSLHGYTKYFLKDVRGNSKAVFHNGDLYPPDFKRVRAVTWYTTEKDLTEKARLTPKNVSDSFQPEVIDIIASGNFGKKMRKILIDPLSYSRSVVVWRNHEASYDVLELEPKDRKEYTYVLQEYFVPVNRLEDFVQKARPLLRNKNMGVVNLSIRHAHADLGSYLAWAPEEVFSLVLYYRQKTDNRTRDEIGKVTRKLIDAALGVGGTYYLPYQIWATKEQFRKSYPRSNEFFQIKKKWDPLYKFSNSLIDTYIN